MIEVWANALLIRQQGPQLDRTAAQPSRHAAHSWAAPGGALSLSGDWLLALVLEASTAGMCQATAEERRRERPRDMGRWRRAVPGVGAAAASACATPAGRPGEPWAATWPSPGSLAAGGVSTASSNAST